MPAPTATSYNRCPSRLDADDELRAFRSCLRWICLDQSNSCTAIISFSVFVLLGLVVPAISHFWLTYRVVRMPYDLVVQSSLTLAAALSFFTLSTATRHYGLRKFLSLDKLHNESKRVRQGYMAELHGCVGLLAYFVLPCFAAEVAYKVWWYIAGNGRIPYIGHRATSYSIACVLQLTSWIYRVTNFFLVCVLFRLVCCLQVLRLEDFVAVFQVESEVGGVLKEHLRLRKQFKVMSHRFRTFILFGMVLVTLSQLAAAVVTLRPRSDDELLNTADLAISSLVLVTGLIICLRSAVTITHKAQALTGHAAKWHVCESIDAFNADAEAEAQPSFNSRSASLAHSLDADSDEEGTTEDELEGAKIVVYPHVHTINFQQRQALVTYLENNRAGITIFGFTLDRAWLQAIFTLEMMTFLWVFSKTIGIS